MANTNVWSTYVGKRAPDDNGKRWVAWCDECRWRTVWPWKGGHRLATAAAVGHQCPQ